MSLSLFLLHNERELLTGAIKQIQFNSRPGNSSWAMLHRPKRKKNYIFHLKYNCLREKQIGFYLNANVYLCGTVGWSELMHVGFGPFWDTSKASIMYDISLFNLQWLTGLFLKFDKAEILNDSCWNICYMQLNASVLCIRLL